MSRFFLITTPFPASAEVNKALGLTKHERSTAKRLASQAVGRVHARPLRGVYVKAKLVKASKAVPSASIHPAAKSANKKLQGKIAARSSLERHTSRSSGSKSVG